MANQRIEALREAREHRKKEVLYHQINIDNYRLAIAKIDSEYEEDATLVPFREQLCTLLASSVLEQKKDNILLSVIEMQLDGDI